VKGSSIASDVMTERDRETTVVSSAISEGAHCPTPYLTSRRVGNRIAAASILLLAAPIVAVLALLIRSTSRGPALFRQTRLGRGGRPFEMLKLRTMVVGAETMRPGSWTGVDDARITPLGWRLRRWHLDELPQLVNVVRGEMALVGPRPERPEIARRLREVVPGYDDRLQVAPGIVGLAQINLPPDTSIDSVRAKLALDLEYIRTASLGLDLRMLLWSCARLAGIPFGVATRALGLERAPHDGDTAAPERESILNRGGGRLSADARRIDAA